MLKIYETAKMCLGKVGQLVCSLGPRLFKLFCEDINMFMQGMRVVLNGSLYRDRYCMQKFV